LYEARLHQFNTAVSECCAWLEIAFYETHEAATKESFMDERVGDGLHATLETRLWDAEYLARLVIAGLREEAE
jgi:hypothetical protein